MTVETHALSSNAQALETCVVCRGRFNGVELTYEAEVSTHEVVDEVSQQIVHLVCTSYVRTPVDSNRPVIIVFNGGPISPSVYLHMLAFGPKYVAFPDDLDALPDSLELRDNPNCLLDVADLVMFDPAGTGFSKVGSASKLADGFSVEADARQLVNFVKVWTGYKNRRVSPVYFFGESYGTIRAAVAARQVINDETNLKVSGVMLLGQALNIVDTVQRPANVLSYVASLPTLAATAWYHNKVDRGEMSLVEFLERAAEFAGSEYLLSLMKGNDLDSAGKEIIAGKLSEFTGVSAKVHLENNIRLTKMQFRNELLRERGQVLSFIDSRYTSEGFSTTADPATALHRALYRFHGDYLKGNLKLQAPDSYEVSSPVTSLDAWDWHNATPFSDWPYLADINMAMAADSNLRVWVGVGYFDLMTTLGATLHAIKQSEWPRDRTTLCCYEGGHMPYTVERNLRKLMDDIRCFIVGDQQE
ncbi:S10 family serine carboxypeptidase-like protein [Pseudomonas putida]|uniref:S10 family serine carboxypeptidase-like protein n=1 Tax=Pseudomonas putida TaxID=303 RepID=UPI0009A1F411|nr:hypothetical protein [Pseudomonas putida]